MSATTTITLSANGVSASLSVRDDLRKPRELQLVEGSTTASSASATATADFHEENQWVITWLDSEQERQGIASLCADIGKLESEPEWWQGSSGGFYIVKGQCGLADSKGVLCLSLELSLPSTDASSASDIPSQPYVSFQFTVASTLDPQQFWRSSEIPSSSVKDVSSSATAGEKVDQEDSAKDDKQELGPLVVKLKRTQPRPSRILVESESEEDEMERSILSPIEEVTEPPTSPPIRSSSVNPLPSLHPTSNTSKSLKRPHDELNPTSTALPDSNLAEPPAKRARSRSPAESQPSSVAAAGSTSKMQHTEPYDAPSSYALPHQPQPQPHHSPALFGVPNAPPRAFSSKDLYGGHPTELQTVLERNNMLKSRLTRATELNSHYMDTATLLLNRLPPRQVCEHLMEQLMSPRLAPEQRVEIALAKQRAMAATKRLAAVEIDAESRS
ncbi:hypothetical protein BCR35DRAFT_328097 [Leucosporidium creatinivorum]|uniref:Uncharacterized protein n=1 Tax=Leucosporidium creatinivorum TaxID=106004 RepID=A0A1Y2G280_9BASI|nr:hypothetical protein BCR35DRAFT_328097 [Leucosporidium creatinivorum]